MILWIEAQLPPTLAQWLNSQFDIEAYSVKRIGLRDATDKEIFFAAREAGAVMMTKDQDFLNLLDKHGPPPQVIWITFGNTSNKHLRDVLSRVLAKATALLESGEQLVAIGEPQSPPHRNP